MKNLRRAIYKAPNAEDMSPHICAHVDEGVCVNCANPTKPWRSLSLMEREKVRQEATKKASAETNVAAAEATQVATVMHAMETDAVRQHFGAEAAATYDRRNNPAKQSRQRMRTGV